MSDFPSLGEQSPVVAVQVPVIKNVLTWDTGCGQYYSGFDASKSVTAGATWPTANKAWYMPFYLNEGLTVYQMGVWVATSSGNVDVGIYDEFGTRLVSLGSTACPSAGPALLDISNTALVPGTYYAALAVDNTTASLRRLNTPAAGVGRTFGVQVQTSAFALPATATFTPVDAAYYPWITLYMASTV